MKNIVYTTVEYGGETLNVISVTPTKVPSTRKQRIGNRLIMNEVFSNNWDYNLVIEGIILGSASSISTKRDTLLNLQDNLKHAYSDGNSERDGNYVILNLVFNEDSRTAAPVTNLRYTITLRQDLYTGGLS